MNKVIIIDDRQDRDKPRLSKNAQEKLEEMVNKNVLTSSLGINNGIPLDSFFSNYSLIAIHRSYLVNHNLFPDVYDYAKNNEKFLIIFSGGIGQNSIQEKGYYLEIEASDFYSDSLASFLEEFCKTDMKHPLLKYLYRDSWRLTLLLEYRSYLWRYDDIDNISNDNDASRAEELHCILWNDDDDVTIDIEMINEEIELEITKIINS